MNGEIEFGYCDYCGKECDIHRKYYYYGIKCECHSQEHFEIVFYCNDCKPKSPRRTSIALKPTLER